MLLAVFLGTALSSCGEDLVIGGQLIPTQPPAEPTETPDPDEDE